MATDKSSKDEDVVENRLVFCSLKDEFLLSQDLCVICGGLGRGEEGWLIICSQCGQCYHPYCANVKVTRTTLTKGWRCLECTVCEGCGQAHDEARLLLCDECDISYHTYCLDPPLDDIPTGTWKCEWCVVCVKCDSKSPGVNSLWQNNYTECGPCSSQTSCPVCRTDHKESDLIIECNNCKRWLHAKCDGLINEDDCEKAAEFGYRCILCRPKDEPPLHLQALKLTAVQKQKSHGFEDGQRIGNISLNSPLASRRSSGDSVSGKLTNNLDSNGSILFSINGNINNAIRDASYSSGSTPDTVNSVNQLTSQLSMLPSANSFKNSPITPSGAANAPGSALKSSKNHFLVDGVVLSERGMSLIKSLQLEPPKKQRAKRGSKAGSLPLQGSKDELDESMRDDENGLFDELKVPDPDASASKEASDANEKKKRQRRLHKLGIGGFSVKARARLIKEEDVNENSNATGDQNGMDNTENVMQNDKPKRRRRIKKRSHLQENFPSYLQEAFFGKDLMDSSREPPANSVLETREKSSQSPCGDEESGTTFKITSDKIVKLFRSSETPTNAPISSTPFNSSKFSVKLESLNNNSDNMLHKLSVNDETSNQTTIDDDDLNGLLPSDIPQDEELVDLLYEDPDLERSADNLVELVEKTVNGDKDDAIENVLLESTFNLESMVVDSGLPHMDIKDVEDVFQGVSGASDSPSTVQISSNNSIINQANPSLLNRNLVGVHHPHPHPLHLQQQPPPPLPPPQHSQSFSTQPGSFSMVPNSDKSQGLPQNRVQTASDEELKKQKILEEEGYGANATISAVLYANLHYPDLKKEFPNDDERHKQINKYWRQLPADSRSPIRHQAKKNRQNKNQKANQKHKVALKDRESQISPLSDQSSSSVNTTRSEEMSFQTQDVQSIVSGDPGSTQITVSPNEMRIGNMIGPRMIGPGVRAGPMNPQRVRPPLDPLRMPRPPGPRVMTNEGYGNPPPPYPHSPHPRLQPMVSSGGQPYSPQTPMSPAQCRSIFSPDPNYQPTTPGGRPQPQPPHPVPSSSPYIQQPRTPVSANSPFSPAPKSCPTPESYAQPNSPRTIAQSPKDGNFMGQTSQMPNESYSPSPRLTPSRSSDPYSQEPSTPQSDIASPFARGPQTPQQPATQDSYPQSSQASQDPYSQPPSTPRPQIENSNDLYQRQGGPRPCISSDPYSRPVGTPRSNMPQDPYAYQPGTPRSLPLQYRGAGPMGQRHMMNRPQLSPAPSSPSIDPYAQQPMTPMPSSHDPYTKPPQTPDGQQQNMGDEQGGITKPQLRDFLQNQRPRSDQEQPPPPYPQSPSHQMQWSDQGSPMDSQNHQRMQTARGGPFTHDGFRSPLPPGVMPRQRMMNSSDYQVFRHPGDPRFGNWGQHPQQQGQLSPQPGQQQQTVGYPQQSQSQQINQHQQQLQINQHHQQQIRMGQQQQFVRMQQQRMALNSSASQQQQQQMQMQRMHHHQTQVQQVEMMRPGHPQNMRMGVPAPVASYNVGLMQVGNMQGMFNQSYVQQTAPSPQQQSQNVQQPPQIRPNAGDFLPQGFQVSPSPNLPKQKSDTPPQVNRGDKVDVSITPRTPAPAVKTSDLVKQVQELITEEDTLPEDLDDDELLTLGDDFNILDYADPELDKVLCGPTGNKNNILDEHFDEICEKDENKTESEEHKGPGKGSHYEPSNDKAKQGENNACKFAISESQQQKIKMEHGSVGQRQLQETNVDKQSSALGENVDSDKDDAIENVLLESSFNLESMVVDSGLPHMDIKDVEDVFQGVSGSPSTVQISSNNSIMNQPNPSLLNRNLVGMHHQQQPQSQPLTSPQHSQSFSTQPGSFSMVPNSDKSQGLPQNRVQTASDEELKKQKILEEEGYGANATISAVLYANLHYPDLKKEFPNDDERHKQINKYWRQLPADSRSPIRHQAKKNRQNKNQKANQKQKVALKDRESQISPLSDQSSSSVNTTRSEEMSFQTQDVQSIVSGDPNSSQIPMSPNEMRIGTMMGPRMIGPGVRAGPLNPQRVRPPLDPLRMPRPPGPRVMSNEGYGNPPPPYPHSQSGPHPRMQSMVSPGGQPYSPQTPMSPAQCRNNIFSPDPNYQPTTPGGRPQPQPPHPVPSSSPYIQQPRTPVSANSPFSPAPKSCPTPESYAQPNSPRTIAQSPKDGNFMGQTSQMPNESYSPSPRLTPSRSSDPYSQEPSTPQSDIASPFARGPQTPQQTATQDSYPQSSQASQDPYSQPPSTPRPQIENSNDLYQRQGGPRPCLSVGDPYARPVGTPRSNMPQDPYAYQPGTPRSLPLQYRGAGPMGQRHMMNRPQLSPAPSSPSIDPYAQQPMTPMPSSHDPYTKPPQTPDGQQQNMGDEQGGITKPQLRDFLQNQRPRSDQEQPPPPYPQSPSHQMQWSDQGSPMDSQNHQRMQTARGGPFTHDGFRSPLPPGVMPRQRMMNSTDYQVFRHPGDPRFGNWGQHPQQQGQLSPQPGQQQQTVGYPQQSPSQQQINQQQQQHQQINQHQHQQQHQQQQQHQHQHQHQQQQQFNQQQQIRMGQQQFVRMQQQRMALNPGAPQQQQQQIQMQRMHQSQVQHVEMMRPNMRTGHPQNVRMGIPSTIANDNVGPVQVGNMQGMYNQSYVQQNAPPLQQQTQNVQQRQPVRPNQLDFSSPEHNPQSSHFDRKNDTMCLPINEENMTDSAKEHPSDTTQISSEDLNTDEVGEAKTFSLHFEEQGSGADNDAVNDSLLEQSSGQDESKSERNSSSMIPGNAKVIERQNSTSDPDPENDARSPSKSDAHVFVKMEINSNANEPVKMSPIDSKEGILTDKDMDAVNNNRCDPSDAMECSSDATDETDPRGNVLLKQLLKDCRSADSQEAMKNLSLISNETAAKEQTTTASEELIEPKEVNPLENGSLDNSSTSSSINMSTVTITEAPIVPDPNFHQDSNSQKSSVEASGSQDWSVISTPDKSVESSLCKKKVTSLDIRRAQLERDPTPPPEETKPKRKRPAKKKESKSSDGPAKKRSRKASNTRTDENYALFISNFMAQVEQQLEPLRIQEPMITPNYNICPVFGSGDLNAQQSTLKGVYGKAYFTNVQDFYSPETLRNLLPGSKSTKVVEPPPSQPSSAKSFYNQEFSRGTLTGSQYVLDRATSNDSSRRLRDCDSPESIVSSSSPECVQYEETDYCFKVLRDLEERGTIKREKERLSPAIPLLRPVPLKPGEPMDEDTKSDSITDRRSSSESDSEKNKENIDKKSNGFRIKPNGVGSHSLLRGSGNVSVTLTLSSSEDIKGILFAIADLLDIKPPIDYELDRSASPSSVRGMLPDESSKLDGDISVDSFLGENNHSFCRFCEVLVITAGVKVKWNDLPASARESADKEEYATFCSEDCVLRFGSSYSSTMSSENEVKAIVSHRALDLAPISMKPPMDLLPPMSPMMEEDEIVENISEPAPPPLLNQTPPAKTDLSTDNERIKTKLPWTEDENASSSSFDQLPTSKRWSGIKYKSWSPEAFETPKKPKRSSRDRANHFYPDIKENFDLSFKPKSLPPDERRCVLCHIAGDGPSNGSARLLNMDVDKWVHLNCALWSSEVYETVMGALMNVDAACKRGSTLSCVGCRKMGASLKCFKLKCTSVYHFPCAISDSCVFFKDKSLLCAQHVPKGYKPEDVMDNFMVPRRVYVSRDEHRQMASMIHSDEQNLMRIGSLIFLNIGQLLPHQLHAFHSPTSIYPVGYKVNRFFWSMRALKRRCKYICSIVDNDGRPQFIVEVQEEGFEKVIYRADSPKAAWQEIISSIVRMRKDAGGIKIFNDYISGEDLFGLSEQSVMRILESLPGVDSLPDYNFRFGRSHFIELPLPINPTGCARTEPRVLLPYKRVHTLQTRGAARSSLQSISCSEERSPYIKQFFHSKSQQYKKMKVEWRMNVFLARSRIAGLGLYAARDIEKHTMVIEYIGQLIRNEIAERNERLYQTQNRRGVYMFRLDENRVVDATLSGGLARYINHSCNPNCVAEVVQIDRENKILIIASRRIARGEELTYDYRFDVEDDSSKIPCLCGAPNCRKWMN